MYGPLAWQGTARGKWKALKLPLPELRASVASDRIFRVLFAATEWRSLRESLPHAKNVLKLASADTAQASTHRHFHLKLISVELEGYVRESPLEEARGSENEDELQVGWE